MKKNLLLSIIMFIPGFSLAQDNQSDTVVYRYPSEVIITAPRMSMSLKEIPFSASVVTSEVVDNLPRAIAIDEMMKLVPGVKIDNQANGSRIHMSIRGQGILSERGIRGIKILLDDIPINDPTGFAPDLFDIDYHAVDMVEVLRGPAASLYGGSASGGVVNVVTQNGGTRPVSAEAAASFGSNNFWKGFGQFGGNAIDANYRVSFSRTGGNGFRDHTHFWGNNVYGKVAYTPTDFLQITPLFSWTDFYHENPEGVTLDQYRQNIRMANPDAIPFNEFLETNRSTFGLSGYLKITDRNDIQFSGFAKRTFSIEANNRTFNHRTITTPGTSLQYTHHSGGEHALLRNDISIGTDAQWQTIEERRTDNLHSVEGDTTRSKEKIAQSGLGVFVIDRVGVGKEWGLVACFRFDGIQNKLTDQLKTPYDLSGSANFSKATARVGADYSPLPDVSFFANWGQGFLPPATEELAQNPDHFGGFNTHLTYATSEGFEVGSRGLVGRLMAYEITGFFMTTDNDFDRYRITDPLRNQETFYRNVGSSARAGAEFYGSYSPVNSLRIQIAYTYADYKYTNADPLRVMMDDTTIVKYIRNGNQLPNSPQHQFYVDVEYSVLPELMIGISAEGLSKWYIDGANIESEAANAYTQMHARIRYGVPIGGIHCELSVSVRNLTDKQFIAFTEPDPGGNAYQPGPRREVFAAARFRL
jgi:iron complex outermembrane recepter protein